MLQVVVSETEKLCVREKPTDADRPLAILSKFKPALRDASTDLDHVIASLPPSGSNPV
jgi:hypothetical protein